MSTEQRPKLRVGVVPSIPSNYEAVDCFADLPKKPCSKPGFEIEIFQGIMKLLGWDYEFVKTSEAGEPNPLTPGNWTGLMGLAQSRQIDMSVTTMRVTPERNGVVDFSFPAWYYQQTYIIRQPAEHDPHQFMFRPYQTDVWLFFAGVLLLASIVEWLIVATIRFSGRPLKKKLQYGQHAMWNFFAILLKQDEQDKFRFVSSVLLAKIWVFACLIMVTYYQSIMNSLLAVPLRTKIPFTNFASLLGLLERDEWHLTYPYGQTLNVYPESPSVALERRLKVVLEYNPVRKDAMGELTAEGSRAAYYGTYFLDGIQHPVSWFNRDLKWYMIRDDSIAPKFGSFLFQKGSPYRHRFDAKLIELLPGISRIKERYVQALTSAYTKVRAQEVQLTFLHFQELMIMWAAGCGASVIVFFLELYGWRRAKRLERLRLQSGPIALLIRSQMKMAAFSNREEQEVLY